MDPQGVTGRTAAKKPARRPKAAIWGGAAGIVVLVLAIAYWSGLFGEDEPEPQTVEVVRGDIEKTVNSLGSLKPQNYVDVGAQVSGQLVRIHVEVGDTVEKDQLLAEIDARVLESRVRTGRSNIQNFQAQLALQRAQLALAEQQAARNRRLFEGNAVSEDLLQTSETAVDVGKSQVAATVAQQASAQATLDGDLAQLGYTKIYAPISGTVVSQTAYLGQTLNANQTAPIVLRIADLSKMTVEADVSEADVVKLTPGIPAYFTTLGDPSRRWVANVRQIMPTPEVVNEVVLFKVLLDVDNTDGALMTDMTAQVFFIQGEARDVLVVPVTALEKPRGDGAARGERRARREAAKAQPGGSTAVDGEGSSAAPERRRRGQRGEGPRKPGDPTPYVVKVMGEDGPEERAIMVGLMNRTDAEVLSGLKEGEQVILPLPPAAGQQANGPGQGRQGGGGFRGGPRL
ncbi:efflux RND transporter periplasmic adaptor subunit [Iodidimonas sp. SYSU 1G8]|uniref:efflux RND transporter periplasmic adaptor subunit n=1 Tax=Iodidimonas sp. SYSU 1G8 TaxID=3133967 RepID=UPI0031FE8089